MAYRTLRSTGIWLILILLLAASCNNQSIMFRAKRNYPYDDLTKIQVEQEYRIGINDKLSIKVTTNKGAILIEPIASTATGGTSNYLATVEFDGTIKMPLLGRVKVQGLSVRECELLFEEQYKLFYVEPFAQVEITNKRVIVFPGTGGSASVVSLHNKNTSLLEVIAAVGGLSSLAKAHRIKLIRGDLNNPKVYFIDLSKIDNIHQGGIILQGNDIIYIDPRNDLVLNWFARVSPYIAVINLAYFVYAMIPGK